MMEKELTEVLRDWVQNGHSIVSAVLEERSRLLAIAAQERDSLTTEIRTARNENRALRAENVDLKRIHQEECRKLRNQIDSLSRESKSAADIRSQSGSAIKKLQDEKAKLNIEFKEKEKATEGLLAALQESLNSEARLKLAASASIEGIRSENVALRKKNVEEFLRANREKQRAENAERLAQKHKDHLSVLQSRLAGGGAQFIKQGPASLEHQNGESQIRQQQANPQEASEGLAVQRHTSNATSALPTRNGLKSCGGTTVARQAQSLTTQTNGYSGSIQPTSQGTPSGTPHSTKPKMKSPSPPDSTKSKKNSRSTPKGQSNGGSSKKKKKKGNKETNGKKGAAEGMNVSTRIMKPVRPQRHARNMPYSAR